MTHAPHDTAPQRPDPAAAAEQLERGLGRRGFVQAALATGALLAAGVATAPAATGTSPRRTRLPGEILQPGKGPIDGDSYLASLPDQVLWGYLPRTTDAPVATVRSGRTITVDTVSHEGILEDQGRDPVAWFGGKGVPRERVLETPSPSHGSTRATTATSTPMDRTWSRARCSSRAHGPATC